MKINKIKIEVSEYAEWEKFLKSIQEKRRKQILWSCCFIQKKWRSIQMKKQLQQLIYYEKLMQCRDVSREILDQKIIEMQNAVNFTYNNKILTKFVPAIVTLQRQYRSYRDREKFKTQTYKLIRVARAFRAMERYEKDVAFWHAKCAIRSLKSIDYRMSQRLVKRKEKKHWQKHRKDHRDQLTLLKFYFIGGVLNKFFDKWEMDKKNLSRKGPPLSDLNQYKQPEDVPRTSLEKKKSSHDSFQSENEGK